MKINEKTAILTPRILLVPYCPHHVPTYHAWMQDPTLQALTASEPLSLEAEHAMQQSWRLDGDKLTFIICSSPSPPLSSSSSSTYPSPAPPITPGHPDAPHHMIGDINLFLYLDPDSDIDDNDNDTTKEIPLIGELEIMLASPPHRGQGLARESLLAFLTYISRHEHSILYEYTHGEDEEENEAKTTKLKYLRVKIGQDNVRSVRLFEGVGFEIVGGGANYFGEVELRVGWEGGVGWRGERVGVEVGYGV